jgi:hypothetical protein
MDCDMKQNSASVETLVAAIAHSPIVIRPPVPLLPQGFEEVDIAILSWLAAEAERIRRNFVLMH